MSKLFVMLFFVLAACGGSSEPAPSADADAMAAASRKAVADTDAALRDASTPATSGKVEQTSN